MNFDFYGVDRLLGTYLGETGGIGWFIFRYVSFFNVRMVENGTGKNYMFQFLQISSGKNKKINEPASVTRLPETQSVIFERHCKSNNGRDLSGKGIPWKMEHSFSTYMSSSL